MRPQIGSIISAPMPIARAEFNSIHVAAAVNRVLSETVDRESGAAAMPVAMGCPTRRSGIHPRINIPTTRAVRLARSSAPDCGSPSSADAPSAVTIPAVMGEGLKPLTIR